VGRRVSCFCQGFPVSYGASHAVTELVLLKKPYQILSFTVWLRVVRKEGNDKGGAGREGGWHGSVLSAGFFFLFQVCNVDGFSQFFVCFMFYLCFHFCLSNKRAMPMLVKYNPNHSYSGLAIVSKCSEVFLCVQSFDTWEQLAWTVCMYVLCMFVMREQVDLYSLSGFWRGWLSHGVFLHCLSRALHVAMLQLRSE
jgi:hypothetical protein